MRPGGAGVAILTAIIAAVVSYLAAVSYLQYQTSYEIFIVTYFLIEHQTSIQNDCLLWEPPICML
jgi:hypothetical protein